MEGEQARSSRLDESGEELLAAGFFELDRNFRGLAFAIDDSHDSEAKFGVVHRCTDSDGLLLDRARTASDSHEVCRRPKWLEDYRLAGSRLIRLVETTGPLESLQGELMTAESSLGAGESEGAVGADVTEIEALSPLGSLQPVVESSSKGTYCGLVTIELHEEATLVVQAQPVSLLCERLSEGQRCFDILFATENIERLLEESPEWRVFHLEELGVPLEQSIGEQAGGVLLGQDRRASPDRVESALLLFFDEAEPEGYGAPW